ncbi:MAG: lipid A deacylase LpxR family protein [Rubrivivax sp.]|nr:lipid A deacylase LpxR family protein [Rubrivivax sp.]
MLPALAQSTPDSTSGAAACEAAQAIEFRGLTVRLENDLFVDTDRNYTNGAALTAVSRDIAGSLRTECLPAPVRLHAELIKWLNPGFWSDAGGPAHSQNVVVKFGQSIYTPNDPLRTDLIADDRPYAGLLYVGMSWNRRTHAAHSDTEMLDTREITLGVIGPWSLARQAQNLIHDAVGSERFLGWDHQLKNEPALQGVMDRKFRGYRGDGATTPGFSADSIRSIGLRLGNIETSVSAGIEGRIGWNLPNDFGTYPIRPGAENRSPSSASLRGGSNEATGIASGPRAGVHLFGMLEAKFVAHDFSLDGNLFRSSHQVTRRPWVAQAAVGLSAQGLVAGHGVKLAVMRVYRSPEFREQPSNHAYGSVALSLEY